ncbi:AraC family transcriptional regulator [Clostridia bacterium]|nr:AraC family transcriptional regulator [Clostridia bacterium]
MNYNRKLSDIIDISRWQKLQDSLSEVTGMAIITADYKGVPITQHSGCRSFCKRVRAERELNQYCERCDSLGGFESMRINEPYIYLCHFNILDAAIPISVDGTYIGAVLAGQVILNEQKDIDSLDKIFTPPNQKLFEEQSHIFTDQIVNFPELSLGRVTTIVTMLFHLCNYIVEDSIKRDILIKLLSGDREIVKNLDTDSFETFYDIAERLNNIQVGLSNAVMNIRIPDIVKEDSKIDEGILKPAYDYINDHKSERCKLKDLAALCHISPSYFSKRFLKETGENFSAFLLNKRIGWAKTLLNTTDRKISQIADDLGFSDAGHFVKMFKKCEGITPARFRSCYRSKIV